MARPDLPDPGTASTPGLTHRDAEGHARMVDVSAKAVTDRVARARCAVRMSSDADQRFQGHGLPKGDPVEVIRLAAIQGAKQTANLIPLCHPLRLTRVDADVRRSAVGRWVVEVVVRAQDRTGVEMEAMVGAAVGGLALYDMVKGVDRGAALERVELLHKSGGKGGTWERTAEGQP